MTARWVLSALLIFMQVVTPVTFAETLTPPQNVTATVKVRATPAYFYLAFNTRGNPIPQNTNVEYAITYGSLVSYAVPITLTATWTRGILEGNSTPNIDVVSYVDSSATKGYAGAPPVIDTVKRTITWFIPSFPENTPNQTVHFSLRTFDANYDQTFVKFNVRADMTVDDGITMPEKNVEHKYLFDPTLITPTITPTPLPLTPTPSLTPFNDQGLQFSSISIQTISSTQASIAIVTNKPTTQVVQYGLSPTSLSEKVIALTPSIKQLITLSNLSPNTQYYFQVLAKDSSGKTYTSNLYTFTTASLSTAPSVQIPTIVITSDNKIMTTRFDGGNTQPTNLPTVLLPQNTPYAIQFSFDQKQPITTAQIIVRNKYVLGKTTPYFIKKAFAATDSVDMIEIRPGVFTTKAQTSPESGTYELIARSNDENGNITEQKVAQLTVSPPLTVTDVHNSPLENARVLLSVYRKSTDEFVVFANHTIQNPTFTNLLGESPLVLPPGTYKAHVTTLGYKAKDVVFTIGPNETDGYPTVELTGDTYNALNFVFYMWDTVTDISNSFVSSMQSLAASSRVFDFTTLALLWMFVISTFLAFTIRTHTHPKTGISQLGFMLHHLIDHQAKKQYVLGTVLDKKTHTALSKARVFLIDDNTKNILYETLTNKKGSFLLKIPLKQYHILAVKEGFEPSIVYPNKNDMLYISLHANTHHSMVKSQVWHTVSRIISMLFESLLVFSLIMEIFLTEVFGIEKTWPFVALSILNFFLWLYYLSLKHHKEI